MEIDPPEKPIRSIRDFVIHILTVTIGILIALGLEALVEAHRNRELADHTRADFRAEFTHNRAQLVADIAASDAVRIELEGLIQYGSAKLANQPATLPKLEPSRSFVVLPSTAWETAVATQAFLHLPFAETRGISAAYSRQQAFNAVEARAEEQWFTLAAYGDVKGIGDADIKPALEKTTIAYAYVTSILDLERRLIVDYDNALSAIGK